MFDKFLQELETALAANAAPHDVVVEFLAGYKAEYQKLSTAGKTDFEIIVGFGDPEEIAGELKDPDTVVSDEDKLWKNPLIDSARKGVVVEVRDVNKDDEVGAVWVDVDEAVKPSVVVENDDVIVAEVIAEGQLEQKQEPVAWYKWVAASLLGVLAAAINLVFLGVSGFIVWAAFPYLWRSFTEFETAGQRWGGFVVAILALLTAVVIVYCSVLMIIKAYKFIKNYLYPKATQEPAEKIQEESEPKIEN